MSTATTSRSTGSYDPPPEYNRGTSARQRYDGEVAAADAAIVTLREGLESQEWSVNNAAFFLFRMAELYEKQKEDMMTSIQLLQQIVELFPETRHSANATHRLRDLGAI